MANSVVVDDEPTSSNEESDDLGGDARGQSTDGSLDEELSQDDDGFQQSLLSRGSKYFKGKHKLERLIRDEKTLAASLEEQDAANLSIHLYNTHALKRRLYPQNEESLSELKSWSDRTQWINAEHPGEWIPRKLWTAWPLPPSDLPEQHQRFWGKEDNRLDAWTIKRDDTRDWKPSRDLEEALLCEFLKQTRVQFREWSSKRRATSNSQARPRKRRRGRESIPSRKKEIAESTRPPGSSSTSPSTSTSEGESSSGSSHTNADNSSTSEDHGDPNENDSDLEYMSDEDEAQRILNPAIRHILTQVDELLMNLHLTRRVNMDLGLPTTKANTDGKEIPAENFWSDTEARVKRRRGAKARKDVDPKLVSSAPARDWSEVLGTAAFIGWDSEVIRRAAQRCGELFGESMPFYTLLEE